VGLFVLAVLAWPAGVQADNIDERLLKEGAKLMRALKENQYKSVGVLKFRVKKGDREPSFEAGLLNANMATRLEYALILANDETKPIGIARDASTLAAALGKGDKKASYLQADFRKRLFDQDYPLAWGKDKVKVDAFLTGMVAFDRDFRKTTVVIEAFEPKSAELKELGRFTVDTDRSILSDSGESFALVKRGDDADALAIEDVALRNEGKASAGEPVENFLDLEIYYGGQKQEIVTRKESSERRVAEPPEGKAVSFMLRNKTKERLLVVLRINGINTLLKEGPELQIDRCKKWVLDAKGVYAIKGFHLADNSVEQFKVVSPAGLTTLDPQKMGLIELAVFRESEMNDLLATKYLTNLRGLTPDRSRPATITDLKKVVLQSWGPATTKGLIMPGELKAGAKIEEVQVQNPVYAGSMIIRYYP
jgi:hypothetical protein